MKSYWKAGVIIILLSITTYLCVSIRASLLKKEQIAKNIEQVPAFNLPTITGRSFTEQDILGKKSILVYYGVTCDFCEAEAVQIKQNAEKLKDFNVIMISNSSKQEVEKFRKDYALEKNNIQFLLDDQKNFIKTFGIAGEPSILLYNETGGLIRRINGSIHMDKILEILNK